MNNKLLLTITLASLALTSCFESSTSSSGGGNLGTGAFDLEYSFTVPVKINQAAGYFIEGSARCQGATPDTTWNGTTQYKITNGTLLTWSVGSCKAKQYKGSSTQLMGTWTSSNITTSAPITSCNVTPDTTASMYTLSVTFSANSVSIKESDPSYCFADYEASSYTSAALNFTKHGCNSYSITVNGKEATTTLVSINNLSSTKTFNYNGTTCTRTTSGTEPTASVCAASWSKYKAANPSGDTTNFYWEDYTPNGLNFTAYDSCIAATGYVEPN